MNKKTQSSNLWLGLFVISLAVVGFPLALLANVEYCDAEGICQSFISRLGTLPPNEIGDTLAGVFGSLAFFAAAIAVAMQSAELREHRQEFEKMNSTMSEQKFESTFFEMLSAHSEIVSSIDLINRDNGNETRGRDCFRVFYTRFTKLYREKAAKHHKEIALEIAYRNFWKKHQLELGHYFRFLYNFLRFLSESKSTEIYHVRLLRSQLSDQELLIIFYNCLSPQGKPFLEYAEEFEIFDNLPTVRLLEKHHASMVGRKAFGKNPMLTFSDMRHSINKGRRART